MEGGPSAEGSGAYHGDVRFGFHLMRAPMIAGWLSLGQKGF
jgi:hypothetical protein